MFGLGLLGIFLGLMLGLFFSFFFFLDFSSKFVWHKNFEGVPIFF